MSILTTIDEVYSLLGGFGRQTSHEEAFGLYELAKSNDSKVIVEIGVSEGGSFKLWSTLLDSDGMLVGIDAHNILKWDISSTKCNTSFILGDSKNYSTINKLISMLSGRKIDFLRIDGGHDYISVKSDYQNYSPLVRIGGLIAFHDNSSSLEVKRFVDELKDVNDIKYIYHYHPGFPVPETAYFFKEK